jgi:pantetheine-phosphate adenylyltransferase
MAFNLAVCGGTFDHFHVGHKSLLKLAFSLGKRIMIGITSDEYIKNLKINTQGPKLIESVEERRRSVLDFVKEEKALSKVQLVEIDDLFGPTLSRNLPIDVIVVSEESKKGAYLINQKRQEMGLVPLKVVIMPLIRAEDERIISSERIRGGEITREGKLYVKDAWFNKDIKLAENLRKNFQKPFGELLKNIDYSLRIKNHLVITVGDIATKNFNVRSLGQNISVVDFKVAREKKFANMRELGFAGNENIHKVDNPAGHITSGLFRKLAEIIKPSMQERVVLQVNGEEDLAVLPLVLLAPLNTVIYYGQPGKGLVEVTVSEETKNRAYSLISKLIIA